jgi:hypothetical protein
MTLLQDQVLTVGSKRPLRSGLELFPVTILLALQYGSLVIVPALLHRTAPEATILSICACGIGVAFVVEATRWPLGVRIGRQIPITWTATLWIMAVGWAASLTGAVLGSGSYANQIGSTPASHLVSIVTPFTYWPLIGVALTFGLRRQGRISSRTLWLTVGLNLILQLITVILIAILAPLMSFALTVTFLAVLTRSIRLRWVVVAVVLIPLVWPAMYNFRNHRREAQGANVTELNRHNAGSRLRLDLEMAQVALVPRIPDNIGQPKLGTLVRTGLLPRVFDSGRGSFNSASGFSVATGGPADSSDTASTLGLAYIEQGWVGIAIFAGLLSIAIGMAIRRRGPWALVALAILIEQGAWIEATYPDMLAAILQGLVSLAVAMAFAQLFRSRGVVPGSARSGNGAL